MQRLVSLPYPIPPTVFLDQAILLMYRQVVRPITNLEQTPLYLLSPHPPCPLPSIEIEEVEISIDNIRPASLQLPKPLGENAPVHLTEKHVSVMLRVLGLVIGEPSGAFASTTVDLARQLWDLL